MRKSLPTCIPDILRAAFSQSTEPWFSGASRLMATVIWEEMANEGFTPANYGTHRWLKKDPTTNRILFARLDLGNSFECLIESLPRSSRAPYEEGGLVFSKCFSTDADLDVLQSALSLIASVPSLYATVAQYLRALHILESPGVDYDVSHSDPGVPFSIFASVPLFERKGRLRLAESIIHECMHLQLTMAEEVLPLVEAPEVRLFSPWRQTLRPVTGVLHGFYVFAVVHEFFRDLSLTGSLTSDESVFVSERCRQIRDEAAQVGFLASAEGLTDNGRSLVRHLNRCLDL